VPTPPPAAAAEQVSSHVQCVPRPAPLQVWCVGHAVLAAGSDAGQVPSVVHAPCVFVSTQNVPAPVQPDGAGLQTQDALPAPPWQVEFVVHVVEFAALTKRQLFASLLQVETLPLSQKGPVAVHAVALHSQVPEPPHVWCVPQVVVPALNTQLSPSFWQLADAPLALMQMLPTFEPQVASVLHEQAAEEAPVGAHVWCVPQPTAVSA
jgi:hypothetical protein